MRVNTLPLVVLVTAATALVVSAGWVARADDGPGGWMMNRYGSGMMGYAASGPGEPVQDLTGAKRQAQRFADELGLQVGEVMRFTNNYYAELREESGRLATEVLVEPASGAVYLEYGPAMMWNTRYGMMSDFRGRMMGGGGMMGAGGMTGGTSADPTWTPGSSAAAVSPARARLLAQRWLDRRGGGLAAAAPDAFPGYYTLHVLRDGKMTGMLSVNAATGAVWSHWWHGRFVSMLEG